jgi:MFS family permease
MRRSCRDRRVGALVLLASRRFGPLFAAQFLSAFNDNALRNALVLMIAYRADPSSALSAQLLIPAAAGIFILPFFLCSATAGQLADAMDKARLIRLIKLLEIPVMLVAAGGVLAGSTATLLALLFVMGIQAAFLARSNTRSCRISSLPASCCSAMHSSKPALSSPSCSARSPGSSSPPATERLSSLR